MEPIAAQALPDETRSQLTSLLQELLVKTHELSFEYSTIECPQLLECPLAQKARELFKTVKKLNELVKQLAAPQQAQSKTQYIG